MSVQEWLDKHSEGLGLLFATAKDRATEVKAIEAFLEVCRLQVAKA